jgi:hypothetical protein
MTAGAPRAPLAKLKASGTLDKNPNKYRGRTEPQTAPLGKPSTNLTKQEVVMWHAYQREAPWLREGDRSLVEFACQLRAKMHSKKGLDLQEGNMFIRVLSKLGMTPTDRSRVCIADPDKPQDDGESFFN